MGSKALRLSIAFVMIAMLFTTSFVRVVTPVAANVVDQDGTPTAMTADGIVQFTTVGAGGACAVAPTHTIPQVQGTTETSPLIGQSVTVQGVVVADFEGPAPAFRGFQLQATVGDNNAATSDGIFVFNNSNNNNVTLGQTVQVTGVVSEFNGQTQITLAAFELCPGTATITPTAVTLPVSSTTFLERYEGMLVTFPQKLHVTEHFELDRFGQVTLTALPRLPQPTNVVSPGAPAIALQTQNNLNKIILDDASSAQNPDAIIFGRGGQPLSAANTLRGGDSITGLTAVLNYNFGAYRIQTTVSPNFLAENPRPTAPNMAGSLRLQATNVLNYFNTFDGLPDTVDNCTNGVGGSAADCRGADTQLEFNRQAPKVVANIVSANADVVGIMELENDGYGATSAIQDLVNRLNTATAPGTYTFINADAATGVTNTLGTDAIKVGLIYKPAKVTPVGTTAALRTGAFGDFQTSGAVTQTARNRPALAQSFRETATNGVFTVSVNHLKSKGSPCANNISPVGPDPDTGDGQANCNLTRKQAAQELVAWLATSPTGISDPDRIIMGDLNSYAKEDPITAIRGAGYTNLIEQFLGANAYSYTFDAQWGYLDHALASASLVAQVAGVEQYHINADEPDALDYNTNFKTPNLQATLYAPDQYRSSDHDSVIIGLNLTVPTAPNLSGSSKTVNSTTAMAGGLITYTLTISNSGQTATTFNLTDTLNANLTYVSSSPLMTVNGQTVSASGTLLGGESRVYTLVVRVNATFTGSITNIATVSGDNQTRSLTAPAVIVNAVTVQHKIYLPLIVR